MASVTESKWFQYLVGIGALVVGVAFTIGFAREIRAHRTAAAKFLAVQATILSHELAETSAGAAGESGAWMPVISYEYTINDHTYRSNNVLPRPTYHTKEWAEEILAHFPVGTVQTAYYNPAQPDQSYLQTTKLAASYYVALSIGLLFIVFGTAKTVEMLWNMLRT